VTPYSTDDIRALFEMVGTYGIAILELPGGLKIVKAPDAAPTLQRSEGHEIKAAPRSVDEDPMLYSDGDVPSFRRV
jgi:hypothetical protein